MKKHNIKSSFVSHERPKNRFRSHGKNLTYLFQSKIWIKNIWSENNNYNILNFNFFLCRYFHFEIILRHILLVSFIFVFRSLRCQFKSFYFIHLCLEFFYSLKGLTTRKIVWIKNYTYNLLKSQYTIHNKQLWLNLRRS